MCVTYLLRGAVGGKSMGSGVKCMDSGIRSLDPQIRGIEPDILDFACLDEHCPFVKRVSLRTAHDLGVACWK